MTSDEAKEKIKKLTSEQIMSAAKAQMKRLQTYINNYATAGYYDSYFDRMFSDNGGDYTRAELEAARAFFNLLYDSDSDKARERLIDNLRETDAGGSYCDEVRAIVGEYEDDERE